MVPHMVKHDLLFPIMQVVLYVDVVRVGLSSLNYLNNQVLMALGDRIWLGKDWEAVNFSFLLSALFGPVFSLLFLSVCFYFVIQVNSSPHIS